MFPRYIVSSNVYMPIVCLDNHEMNALSSALDGAQETFFKDIIDVLENKKNFEGERGARERERNRDRKMV